MYGGGGGGARDDLPPHKDPTPCAACKGMHRSCGAGCLFAPFFPADDAYADSNYEEVRRKYNLKMLKDMIRALSLIPSLQKADRQGAAAAFSMPPRPFRGDHKTVLDALRKEIDECQSKSRLGLLNEVLEFVGFLEKLYQKNSRNALGVEASSSGATDEQSSVILRGARRFLIFNQL